MKSRLLRIVFVQMCLFLIPAISYAAVFYVSTTGTKTSGASTADDWTNTNCYGNINAAIGQISSGDEVIINDGTYYIEDGNYINSVDGNDVPNGNSTSDFTTIKARNTLKVRIENSGGLTYYDQIVRLSSSDQYIHIDGIVGVLSDTNYPPNMFGLDGSYNKITNSIGVRKGIADDYTTVFNINGNHNLVEGCAATGHGRYLFKTAGTGSSDRYNIFRRNVARFDYSDSNQPMASFNYYGDATYGDHAWQNNIALDGHDPRQVDEGNGAYSYVWGAWYFPKKTYNALLQGNIALNNETTWAGFVLDEDSGSYNLSTTNNISWDNGDGFDPRGGGATFLYSHWTIGANTGYAIKTSSNETVDEVSNTLFINNGAINAIDWTTFDNNGFNPDTQATGTNAVTSTDTLSYLPRVESGTDYKEAGSDGEDIGANIIYAYGKAGTFWGDAGYNLLQDGSNGQGTEELWPWENEAAIRDAFAETNTPNSGATPTTNVTTRGFAGITGDYPLTTYIWEYLGNSIGDPATFDYAAGYIGGVEEILPAVNVQIISQN